MPYGCDPILTSFTSITTSSSNCSGEGTKRTYQGLWRMSDVEGRANIALRVARSVARRRQLHWLRVTRITPLTLYREWIVQAARQRGWGGPLPPLPGTTSARARWSTLVYVEKVRPQFLSLRQVGRRNVFSVRRPWQLSPVSAVIYDPASGLPTDRIIPLFSERPVPLRTSGEAEAAGPRQITECLPSSRQSRMPPTSPQGRRMEP
jgi:hypothetical protein